MRSWQIDSIVSPSADALRSDLEIACQQTKQNKTDSSCTFAAHNVWRLRSVYMLAEPLPYLTTPKCFWQDLKRLDGQVSGRSKEPSTTVAPQSSGAFQGKFHWLIWLPARGEPCNCMLPLHHFTPKFHQEWEGSISSIPKHAAHWVACIPQTQTAHERPKVHKSSRTFEFVWPQPPDTSWFCPFSQF